jgi:hypothetical protein
MPEACFGGVVWTDEEGYAEVTLPHYAPGVAARFRYELTPLRPRVRAVIAAELAGNRFAIQTDEPHVKVAWRLGGASGGKARPDDRKRRAMRIRAFAVDGSPCSATRPTSR